MARTPEGKVKDAVVKELKRLGVYHFFPATHGYGRSGVPDIVCCYKGKFIGIECKAKGGSLTALQIREQEQITSNGGKWLLVSGVSEAVLVRAMLEML